MRKVHSDLGDRIYMVDKELNNKEVPKKKSLLRRVTAAGLGLFMLGSTVSGTVSNSEAASVAHAHTNISRSGNVAPPGFYQEGLTMKLEGAYMSRFDKDNCTALLFDKIPKEFRKHPAWWYTLAFIDGKIVDRTKTIFGNNIAPYGVEIMYTAGIDNYVKRHETKTGTSTRAYVEDTLFLALINLTGKTITDVPSTLKSFNNSSKSDKFALLSKINPRSLNKEYKDILIWTNSALMKHYELENDTSASNYTLLEDLNNKWHLPRVI